METLEGKLYNPFTGEDKYFPDIPVDIYTSNIHVPPPPACWIMTNDMAPGAEAGSPPAHLSTRSCIRQVTSSHISEASIYVSEEQAAKKRTTILRKPRGNFSTLRKTPAGRVRLRRWL